jgi:DNA topoisomerase-3
VASYISIARIPDTRQIHNACRNANDLDMRQAMAVEARIALDLRIGAAFTRFATMNLQARIPELSEQTISYGQLT